MLFLSFCSTGESIIHSFIRTGRTCPVLIYPKGGAGGATWSVACQWLYKKDLRAQSCFFNWPDNSIHQIFKNAMQVQYIFMIYSLVLGVVRQRCFKDHFWISKTEMKWRKPQSTILLFYWSKNLWFLWGKLMVINKWNAQDTKKLDFFQN